MDNGEDLAKAYQDIFSGIGFYYRDTTLEHSIIDRYTEGLVLRHDGIIDVTHKNSGLNGNTRYIIASNRARDVSLVNPIAANFGHFMIADEHDARKGASYFVVIDVYRFNDLTQVALLHIKKEHAGLFAKASTNIEEEIVRFARTDFNSEANGPVPEALKGEDWGERTRAPIGFDGQGEFLGAEPLQADDPNAGKFIKGVKKKKRSCRFWQRIKKGSPKNSKQKPRP